MNARLRMIYVAGNNNERVFMIAHYAGKAIISDAKTSLTKI